MNKIRLLDVCTDGYFQGHSNRVFCVPVGNDTTFKDLIEGIEADASSQELTTEFCGFDYKDFEEAIANFVADNADLGDEPIFPKLEDYGEDSESVYAYLTVIKE